MKNSKENTRLNAGSSCVPHLSSDNLQSESSSANKYTGFSYKIKEPAFILYKNRVVFRELFINFLLAAAVIAGFPIYGNISGEIVFPASLYYGLGVSSIFIIIALFKLFKRRVDHTWDGVVENKTQYKVLEMNRNENSQHYHNVYTLEIMHDSGKMTVEKWKDNADLYDYYPLGEKVRHHKGYPFYEKFDKSKDDRVICVSCASLQDMNADICEKCKCPLLK